MDHGESGIYNSDSLEYIGNIYTLLESLKYWRLGIVFDVFHYGDSRICWDVSGTQYLGMYYKHTSLETREVHWQLDSPNTSHYLENYLTKDCYIYWKVSCQWLEIWKDIGSMSFGGLRDVLEVNLWLWNIWVAWAGAGFPMRWANLATQPQNGVAKFPIQ